MGKLKIANRVEKDQTAIAKTKKVEIETVDDLSGVLTDVKNQESSDSALAHALDAQLQVLAVISSPGLSASAYDLMFDSLKSAVQKAQTEKEKEEYQRCAAVMTNSMVFFLHAKLYWENDKWSKEGQELLKNACNLVVDSSVALLKIKTGAIMLEGNAAAQMFENLIANAGGLLNRVIDWFGKGDRIEQYANEFQLFLVSLFDKLAKYKKIYGDQVLLSELVLRYKDDLLETAGDKTAGLRRLNPDNQALVPMKEFKDKFAKTRVLFKILFGCLAAFTIFTFFNWVAGDKWLELFGKTFLFEPLFAYHFFFLEFGWFIKLVIIIALAAASQAGFEFIKKRDEMQIFSYQADAENRLLNIADQYYVEIAELYSL